MMCLTKIRIGAAALSLLALASAILAKESDIFRNATAGFEMKKPAEWKYMTAAQNQANLERTKLTDEEFQKAMAKHSTAPLVAITKYDEPYDDVNPSFKVNIKPYGQLKGKSSTELLKLMLPQLEKAFKDAKVVEGPKEVTISGIKSGYLRIHYTMQIEDGSSFPTASELWIIPHGDFFFMMGAGTRQDEKTGSRKEIQAIVKSIKIDRPSDR